MRPARHHSTVRQEESYEAAELSGRAKPDSHLQGHWHLCRILRVDGQL